MKYRRQLRAAAVVLTGLILAGSAAAQESNLSKLAERARAALAAERFDEAAELYATLAERRPREAELHANLGIAHAMAGRPAQGLGPLERAIELAPALLRAQLFLGLVQLDLGRPERAVEPLRRVLADEESNVMARQALGQALLEVSRYEEAATELEQVTRAVPGSAHAWAALGRSYEGAARHTFEALRDDAPASPFVLLLEADELVDQTRYQEALERYEQAAKRMSGLPGLSETIADLRVRAGRAERPPHSSADGDCEAHPVGCAFLEDRLLDVLRLTKDSRDPGSRYWRAGAFNRLATNAFAHLDELPSSVELHVAKADLHRARGRRADAVSELRAAARLMPHDPSIKRDLAAALYLARNYDEARSIVEPLLMQHPDAPDLRLLYGRILLDALQVDEAMPHLEAAVGAAPTKAEARAALGRALMLKGHPRQAIPHLKAALAADDDGSVHYQLAQAYQRTGQPELARSTLEAYERLRAQRVQETRPPHDGR